MEKMISIRVLEKLPIGGSCVGVKKIHNMDNQEVECIIWVRHEFGHLRKMFFDLHTGEYVCDDL